MAPKKKGGGKGGGEAGRAAAPQVAPAAHNKSLTLSAESEAQVKALLKDLSLVEDPTEASGIRNQKQAIKQYHAVFDELLGLGFNQHQIQEALKALPLGSATLDTTMDWLCLNLPPSQLPRRFAGGQRGIAGSKVKVMAKAQIIHTRAPAVGELPPSESDDDEDDEEEYRPAVSQDQKEEEQSAAEASKAWIRQQYLASLEQDGSGSEAGSSSCSEIDDWELWADPREVERRRSDRQRTKIPVEERRRHVAHELARAKDYAAAAKSAGDKAKQKEVGQIIRGIKQEMERLGLSEAVAMAIVSQANEPPPSQAKPAASSAMPVASQANEPPLPAAKSAASSAMPGANNRSAPELSGGGAGEGCVKDTHADVDGSTPKGGDDVHFSWEDIEGVQEASNDAAPEPSADLAAGQAPQSASELTPKGTAVSELVGKMAESKAEQEEEDWQGGMDFDADFSELEIDSSLVEAKKAADASELAPLPFGSYATPSLKGGKAGKNKSAAAIQEVQTKAPSALLAQYCQKMAWPQPRYERLQTARDVYSYSASLDMGPARGANKKTGMFGKHSYELVGDEEADTSSVQTAQDAAATRALWELQSFQSKGALVVDHLAMLAPMYKALWRRWDSEGGSAHDADAIQASQQARLDFVNSLIGAAESKDDKKDDNKGSSAAPQAPLTAAETAEQEEWEDLVAKEVREAGGKVKADRVENIPEAELTAAQARASNQLRNQFQAWVSSKDGVAMGAKRAGLPIATIKKTISDTLSQTDVVVVCGDTGCGKTTQVPQFIMEEATLKGDGGRINIVCTQPRRIAAISVADRVAVERGEPPPGSGPTSTVGYQVRMDSAVTRDTRITFCTTGILLRRLAADPALSAVTHVIVDEVHERSIQSDFLIALLRELVEARRRYAMAGRGGSTNPPAFSGTGTAASKALSASLEASRSPIVPLKVILMSATLDADLFARYFNGCEVLQTEGRTFPVQQLFLEDVYSMTKYKLAPDSPAALRSSAASAAKGVKKKAGGCKEAQALVASGLGDEDAFEGVLNPYYESELYSEYDVATRRNLGRVNEDYLDYDLVETIIDHIDEHCDEGAVLVFLPGMGEISQLVQRLTSVRRYSQGQHWIIPLHSSVAPDDQRQAFKVPPAGIRKIVIATNIAETSLTIEDVVYVIECGRHKERRYNAGRRMSMLVEDWVSRAAAKQRKGRAGRVRPGTCFCTYTRKRFEVQMNAYQTPEVFRVPLEEMVLQIHLMNLGPAAHFISTLLQPPATKSIDAALSVLQEVGALVTEPEEVLTPLGHHLALLPLDPRLGKLLVLGACLGCLGPAATIAASMSHKSPFSAPMEKKEEAERARRSLVAHDLSTPRSNIASGQASDHLLLVAAYSAWHTALTNGGKKAAALVAKQYFMYTQTLEQLQEMRVQFAGMVADSSLILPPDSAKGGGRSNKLPWLDDGTMLWNQYSTRPAVIKAVLCAALAPNIAYMAEGSASHAVPRWCTPGANWQREGDEVALHPGCVSHGMTTAQFPQSFVAFLEKVQTSRVFLRDVTPVSPMALLIFGGPLRVIHQEGIVVVGDKIRVRAVAQQAVVVKTIRQALDKVLDRMISSTVSSSRSGGKAPALAGSDAKVVSTIVTMLEEDERQNNIQKNN